MRHVFRPLFIISLIGSILFMSICTPLVLAISQTDVQAINGGWPNYVPESENSCFFGASSTPTGINTQAPNGAQAANAKIIMGIAKTDGLGADAALIGLMVGLDESSLLNLANSNVPVSLTNPDKQGVGSDHDSVGVFQQRPSTGWSTIATGDAADANQAAVFQIMTPAYAAEAFFGSPAGSNAPSALSKGLQNISWQGLLPWAAAQKVQASGTPDGSNYQRFVAPAQALINQYWTSATPVPLPVPVTGGKTNTTVSNGASCTNNPAGGNGSYINPFQDPAWGLSRTDQGVDFDPNKPLPILAIGDGVIISTEGNGWPGGVFIMYKLSNGPLAGKCVYVAEHLTNVLPPTTTIHAGQTIAIGLPGYPWTEWGWAQGPGTPSTPYNGANDGTAMDGGKAFARFLISLGAKVRDDPGTGPLYAGNSCK